jgi:hypothetical protein
MRHPPDGKLLLEIAEVWLLAPFWSWAHPPPPRQTPIKHVVVIWQVKAEGMNTSHLTRALLISLEPRPSRENGIVPTH